MSDPKQKQQERDGLDLEAEIVTDLEVGAETAGMVWAGQSAGPSLPSRKQG